MKVNDRSEMFRQYFERIASSRKAYRRRRSYYWNDITSYVSYFIHQEHSVLEVGSGTGEMLNDLHAKRKVGIDFSEQMVQIARDQFKEPEFFVMDASEITLEEKFDVIIMSNLIGVLPDIQRVFTEISKVCHPKTKIIVSHYNYLWEPLIKLTEFLGIKLKTPAQNWLTSKDVKNLLELAGFDVYKTTKRMLFPFNLPLISFLFNKYLAKLPIIRDLSLNTFTFAKPLENNPPEEVSDKYSVSVIIPAMNESGNIEDAILRMPKLGKWTEIIFVEGGSSDDTWEKINEVAVKYKDQYRIKIAQQDGKGKGNAVRKGYNMAKGDMLMILDADLTVPPEDLPKFYFTLATGRGEFINGSRLVYTMEKQAMRFLNVLGNKFFSMLFTFLLDQSFKDTLCGTKVLLRADYEMIKVNRAFFGDFDPFGDFDLIFGAHKLNLKITELPIRYQERTYGSTNISRFKHGLILLKMCFFAARKIKFK